MPEPSASMSYVNPIWPEGQRLRWTRHDAHRFAPPVPPKSFSERRLEQRRAAEEHAAATAEQDAFEREVLALRRELASIRLDYELRRFQRKYSPNQPRVPAGSHEGGQWTSGGGRNGVSSGRTRLADAGNRANQPTQAVMSDATPDPIVPGAQYAQGRYPVDLREEQQLGGHAIEGHVGKSPEFLLARARREALATENRGDLFEGVRIGSFSSLEAANKLVNATLAQNPLKVERITSGLSAKEELEGRFDSITGYEAYARTERSQPYIRDTNGVLVLIVPDGRTSKGYRVDTAFPVNFGR
jgi:hypothetical protein